VDPRAGVDGVKERKFSAPVRNQTPILRSRSPYSGHFANWNNPILIGKIVLLMFSDRVANGSMMFTPRYFSWCSVSCYRPIERWITLICPVDREIHSGMGALKVTSSGWAQRTKHC